MQIESIPGILKEDIPKLHFQHKNVLSDAVLIERRKQLLMHAMVLGNTYHAKVGIIFESSEGLFEVETTIWATTDDFVLLKGSVYLPIGCIHDVIM